MRPNHCTHFPDLAQRWRSVLKVTEREQWVNVDLNTPRNGGSGPTLRAEAASLALSLRTKGGPCRL